VIRVGIVGLGFMGMIHFLSYRKLPGVRVVAICDPKPRRLAGDWSDIQGNFGPRGAKVDLTGVATFADYNEMLENIDLDLVDITLPPHLHAYATLNALRAGRHVFCEKPMSLELDACDAMIEAARQAKRRLYIGHVLPFFPEYAWALETIRSGHYGQLVSGEFRRVIADPLWNKMFWSSTDVGGPLFDLHVHDAHFIRLLFGLPSGVSVQGRRREQMPEFWRTRFDFEDPRRMVTATCGAIEQQSRPFAHGFDIHLEDATLGFDFEVRDGQGCYLRPPTLLTSAGKTKTIDVGGGDPLLAFEAELGAIVASAAADRDNEILSGLIARDAIEMCCRQRDALDAAFR
jgi:predicted dehydrogenase